MWKRWYVIPILLSISYTARAITPLIDSLLISTPMEQQLEFDNILPDGTALDNYYNLVEPPTKELPEPTYQQPTVAISPEIFRLGRIIINPRTQVLYLAPGFVFSNGQAQNWSVYPDGYIDARTISLPVP